MGKWLSFLLLMLSLNTTAKVDTLHINYDTLTTVRLNSWRYFNGDDSNYKLPEYNDSHWQIADSRLIPKRDSIVFDSIAWMRLHLVVGEDAVLKPLVLYLGQHGASEIYLDGVLVDKLGSIRGKDSSMYSSALLSPVIFTVDSAGHHVLAVRYANYHKSKLFGLSGNNSYGMAVNLQKYHHTRGQFQSSYTVFTVVYMLIGLFLSFCFLHLILFLYYKAERPNLYFSLFCLGIGLYFLFALVSVSFDDPWKVLWAAKLVVIPLCAIPVGLSGLSNSLFGKRKWRFWGILILAIIAFIVSFFDKESGYGMVAIILLIAMVEAAVLTIIAIYRKERGARIIGIGILFFTIFFLSIVVIAALPAGIHITAGTTASSIFFFLSIMAIISIPLSMSVYLSWKFATMNKNLASQLKQVKELSDKNLQQEQEKKRILEGQKEQLEKEVAERTSEIREEKRKSDELLLNILPEEIAEELKQRGSSEARYFDHVTVMFTDFVNFTKAGERFSPQELVNELDTCFKAFDEIISKYHIEKIKTIGDAYLCVSGLPSPDEQHAVNTVRAARDILEYMKQRKQKHPDKTFDIRIGIHSGAVVAGIVGVKKFAYDIWGDTVNTAARMESSGEGNKINISHATYELVEAQFNCTYRGEITAKNKGDMRMYFVDVEK